MKTERLPILCIEDDEDTCELVSLYFKLVDYQVKTCSHLDCLNLMHEEKFAAIILDNHFNGIRGTELCRQIREIDQTTPIIFFSGEARREEIDKALTNGASAYLVKPEGFDDLVPKTINLIEQSKVSV